MVWRVFAGLIVALAVGCRSASPPAYNPTRSLTTAPAVDVDRDSGEAAHETYALVAFEQPSFEDDDNPPVEASRLVDGDPAPISTGAAESTCNLETIEAMAIAVNPAIRRARAQLQALRGKHLQAGLPPNPTAGFLSDDINEFGSPGRYGVYFGRQIVRGNKLGLAQDLVCAEWQAAELALQEVEQRLRTDVRLRFYDLLVAIEKIRVADQLVQFSREAVEATEQLVNAQELARTSLLQAQVALQYAEVVRRQASNELEGTRRNLAVLIGEEDLPCDNVVGSLDEKGRLDIEAEFDRILQDSPEIARLYSQVEVARRNLARQCAQPIPNVTWQATVLYGLAGDDVVSGLQVGMPIPILNRNEGAIGQARNQIVAAERNAERTALKLREQLVKAYQTYMDAKLEVEAFRQEILPKSQETIELVSQGFRQGEVGYLELLVAQRSFFQINLANIEQLRRLWRQRITIEGMLLSGSLQQP